MRKYGWLVVAATLTVALSIGVATATAGGGNSANAHLCHQNGWMNLVRADGSSFRNTGECVSYAARGGTLQPKPPCTAGSEDFSEDAEFAQPTTFTGGTIDTAYGAATFFSPAGGILVQGSSWFGTFPDGTHLLFTGFGVTSFQLTFTNAVSSLQLDAESGALTGSTVTLTAYDASNTVVATDTQNGDTVHTLSVSSGTNNIKYFTVSTNIDELSFSNVVWGCAT